MFNVIKRNPTLPLKHIPSAVEPSARTEADPSDIYSYTGYSRFALSNFLKLLSLERGSKVLLPAYICDVILLPFSELGLEPVYYGITDGFQVDFSTLRFFPQTRAMITVNYFGMSQDFDAIESFTREHRLVWINDNSHGFASCYGERKLESFGDFSITSFRKVIPAINGARARINNDAYAALRPALAGHNAPLTVEHRLSRFLVATLLGNLHYRPWKHPDYSNIMAFSEPDIMAFRVDPISRNILNITSESCVQERRYHLYQAVDTFLSERRYPFLERLPNLLQPRNSPMVYPVVVADRAHWENVLSASRDLGIDIHTWPSMPRDVIAGDFFGSVTRWRRLLFLPIHQDLDAEQYCSRLAEVFDSVRV